MNKKLTSVLLLAAFSLACHPGSDSNGPRIRLASEFIPLAIGNSWTYEETWHEAGQEFLRDTVTYTVTRTVNKSGRSYFEYMPTLDTTWFENGDWAYLALDTIYLRYEQPGKVYDWREEGEQLYYDFNAPFDSALKAGLPFGHVKDTSAVSVLAGQFNDCAIMQGGFSLMVRDVFAKGVGLVYREFGGPYRRLMSAKVGGRSYP